MGVSVEESLKQLLHNNRLIWRGKNTPASSNRGLATGYASLDAVLPEGGWSQGSLIEAIVPKWGIGELQLFLPRQKKLQLSDTPLRDNSLYQRTLRPPTFR